MDLPIPFLDSLDQREEFEDDFGQGDSSDSEAESSDGSSDGDEDQGSDEEGSGDAEETLIRAEENIAEKEIEGDFEYVAPFIYRYNLY